MALHGKVPYVPDVFFLVLLSHRDVPAIGLEFVLEELAKGVVLYTECVVQHRGDVILPVDQEENTTTTMSDGHAKMSNQFLAMGEAT